MDSIQPGGPLTPFRFTADGRRVLYVPFDRKHFYLVPDEVVADVTTRDRDRRRIVEWGAALGAGFLGHYFSLGLGFGSSIVLMMGLSAACRPMFRDLDVVALDRKTLQPIATGSPTGIRPGLKSVTLMVLLLGMSIWFFVSAVPGHDLLTWIFAAFFFITALGLVREWIRWWDANGLERTPEARG